MSVVQQARAALAAEAEGRAAPAGQVPGGPGPGLGPSQLLALAEGLLERQVMGEMRGVGGGEEGCGAQWGGLDCPPQPPPSPALPCPGSQGRRCGR